MNAYLHCQSGTSDKVYSLHMRPTDANSWLVLGWYGKRNSTLTSRKAVKLYSTLSQARADFDGRLREKTAKGYQSTFDGMVWPTGKPWPIDVAASLPHAIAQALAADQPLPHNPFSHGTHQRRMNAPQPPNAAGANSPPPRAPSPGAARPPRQAPEQTKSVIPAWILACFYEIPPHLRSQAADILAAIFPDDQHVIADGAHRPEPRAVDWMRAAFQRLPVDQRKPLYRQLSKVLHSDYSHDTDLYRRWIATYERFAAT